MGWLLAAVLVAGAAGAEEPRRVERAAQYGGQGWSVLGGQSLGEGANALTARVGYPGISVGFLHGATPGVDLGFRVAFNYGYEGLTTTLATGLKGEFLSRFQLIDAGSFNLGLSVGAGLVGYFASASEGLGVSVPVGLALGLPVASALTVSITLDAPMFVTFGPFGGLTLPILVGGGLEYFLDKGFAATFDVKMGPALYPAGFRAGSRADFDFQADLGIALKL